MYAAHEAICRVARRAFGVNTALARIGHYGDPPSKRVWGAQCAAYLVAIIFNKAVVTSVLYVGKTTFSDLGDWLFGPLQSTPDAELVMVMVLCPWLLTSLQFWIFDYLLKAKDPATDGGEDDYWCADSGTDAPRSPYSELASD